MEEGEKSSLASADWPLISLRVDLEDRVEEASNVREIFVVVVVAGIRPAFVPEVRRPRH